MNSRVSILESLKAFHLPSVFNPYADVCPLHDCGNAPLIRRRNLEVFLDHLSQAHCDAVWFGRDFGYRGGRRTGIALTDELRISSLNSRIGGFGIQRATFGDVVAERTATEAWKVLSNLDSMPFLWNIFPMHPHENENPMTNRNHSRQEFSAIWHINIELLNLLNPTRVVAIGGDAHKMLLAMGIESNYVRHPSYGGQADFLSGMGNLYKIPIRLLTGHISAQVSDYPQGILALAD